MKPGLGWIFNIDVSLCIQIKKQISIRGRWHWEYSFCGILDHAAVEDCRKFPSLLTNAFLQLVRDIKISLTEYVTSIMKTSWATSRPNDIICHVEENLEDNYN